MSFQQQCVFCFFSVFRDSCLAAQATSDSNMHIQLLRNTEELLKWRKDQYEKRRRKVDSSSKKEKENVIVFESLR